MHQLLLQWVIPPSSDSSGFQKSISQWQSGAQSQEKKREKTQKKRKEEIPEK